jgi:preprotein translocase subunit YajC
MNTATMTMPVPFLIAMATPAGGGASWTQFIPFVLVLAIFYFVILQPMKKKQQKVDEFRKALKAGDLVITTGGIYGQVVKIGTDSVRLQIADNVRIEVATAAIGGYQGKPAVVEPAEQ